MNLYLVKLYLVQGLLLQLVLAQLVYRVAGDHQLYFVIFSREVLHGYIAISKNETLLEFYIDCIKYNNNNDEITLKCKIYDTEIKSKYGKLNSKYMTQTFVEMPRKHLKSVGGASPERALQWAVYIVFVLAPNLFQIVQYLNLCICI